MQTLKEVNERVQAKFPYLEFINYRGARTPSTIRDINCGHTWETRPEHVYGRGLTSNCPICNDTNTKYTEGILKQKLAIKYPTIRAFWNLTTAKKYINLQYDCGHEDSTILSDLMVKGTKSICRICNPQRYTYKEESKFIEEINSINPDLELLDKYVNDNTYLEVRSKSCNHKWKILPHNFLAKHTLAKCPTCEPKSNNRSSEGEEELAKFISKFTKISRNPKILDGYEIDIYLVDLNIGIEYNGEYWHSDKHKDRDYHINKTNLANTKGIRLIQIFEYEWLQKTELVKSKLLSILGQNYKLGARHCEVREIDYPKQFLIENHLQGAGSPTSLNYGLFFKGELISVMTFSKPRFNKNFDFELVRLATLTGITVTGGASKLFNYFLRNNKGKSVISYSDKRWSEGNIYPVLGFNFSHTSDPGYFYARNEKILSRYQCQKHKLKDLFPTHYKDELTEYEIMTKSDYYRVFDCGNDVWYYGTKE